MPMRGAIDRTNAWRLYGEDVIVLEVHEQGRRGRQTAGRADTSYPCALQERWVGGHGPARAQRSKRDRIVCVCSRCCVKVRRVIVDQHARKWGARATVPWPRAAAAVGGRRTATAWVGDPGKTAPGAGRSHLARLGVGPYRQLVAAARPGALKARLSPREPCEYSASAWLWRRHEIVGESPRRIPCKSAWRRS